MSKAVTALTATAALGLALAVAVAVAGPAQAAAPKKFANCTAPNKVYKHGVGRKGATDHVAGKSKPVRTSTVNTALYTANKTMDRDKDGIACEKA